jgi:hypothetical protein
LSGLLDRHRRLLALEGRHELPDKDFVRVPHGQQLAPYLGVFLLEALDGAVSRGFLLLGALAAVGLQRLRQNPCKMLNNNHTNKYGDPTAVKHYD